MQLTTLAAAAAGLAATCTAILLPPEIEAVDIAISDAISFIPDMSQHQSVSVDCPGCPMQVKNKHGHVRTKNGKQNHLELNFEIDGHDDAADRLLLNGFELYPSSDPFHNVLTAEQVWDEAENDDPLQLHHKTREVVPPRLGFSLQIHPTVQDAEQLYKMIALDLQIIEVGNRFVDGVPNVHVQLIKDPFGKLMIGKVDATQPQTLTEVAHETDKECDTFVCKWLSFVDAQMARLRMYRHCFKHGHHGLGLGALLGHHDKPAPIEVGPEPAHHDTTAAVEVGHDDKAGAMEDGHMPGHFKAHGPDGGLPPPVHKHKYSWSQLFKNITSHILLPILIGVVAGVSVSLLGMALGTIIVFLWRTFFRRSSHKTHRRGHTYKAAPSEVVVAAPEEKSGLMANQDLSPTYEDEPTTKSEDV